MNNVKSEWKAEYGKQDCQLTQQRTVGENFYQLCELTLEHATFDGGSVIVKRDLLMRPNAVAVLLYDTALDAVVMVEQFRVGALEHPRSPWLLEIVAGISDEGESAVDVARREVLEETGLEITSLKKIFRYTPSPGGVSEYIDLYLGGVDASHAGGVHGLRDEGEDIKVHLISRESALRMLDSAEIDSSPAIIALQWLALNHAKAVSIVTNLDKGEQ